MRKLSDVHNTSGPESARLRKEEVREGRRGGERKKEGEMKLQYPLGYETARNDERYLVNTVLEKYMLFKIHGPPGLSHSSGGGGKPYSSFNRQHSLQPPSRALV